MRLKVARELFDHREHRRAHVPFVLILARLEPFAIVVALEGAKEAQGVFRETGSHLNMILVGGRKAGRPEAGMAAKADRDSRPA